MHTPILLVRTFEVIAIDRVLMYRMTWFDKRSFANHIYRGVDWRGAGRGRTSELWQSQGRRMWRGVCGGPATHVIRMK